mgnify:CR=1 FL=1
MTAYHRQGDVEMADRVSTGGFKSGLRRGRQGYVVAGTGGFSARAGSGGRKDRRHAANGVPARIVSLPRGAHRSGTSPKWFGRGWHRMSIRRFLTTVVKKKSHTTTVVWLSGAVEFRQPGRATLPSAIQACQAAEGQQDHRRRFGRDDQVIDPDRTRRIHAPDLDHEGHAISRCHEVA